MNEGDFDAINYILLIVRGSVLKVSTKMFVMDFYQVKWSVVSSLVGQINGVFNLNLFVGTKFSIKLFAIYLLGSYMVDRIKVLYAN